MEQRKKIILIALLIIVLIATLFITFVFRQSNDETDNKFPDQPMALDRDGDIRATFEKYLSTKGDKISVDLFKVSDSQNRTVPLDDFAGAIGLRIPSAVSSFLDQDNYSLLTCFSGDGNTYGIVLYTRTVSDSPDFYANMNKAMRDWEPTMFADTKSFLFYNITDPNFSNLNTSITFKSGDFRYADVVFPDGSKKSINYYIKDDSIIITDAKECLYGIL